MRVISCDKGHICGTSLKVNHPRLYDIVLSLGDFFCDAPHLTTSDNKLGCGAWNVVVLFFAERCDENDENDENDETTRRGTEVADNILCFSACPFIRLSVCLFVCLSPHLHHSDNKLGRGAN